MEDILESDSGLFSKDQTLAAFSKLEKGNIYVCILDSVLISSTPLRVHRRWQVWETAWMPAWLSQRGANHHGHHHCPACARAGFHANKLPSHPKSHYIILSSCVYRQLFLKKLWRITSSHVSFLYCQNVSVGDQLWERGCFTAQRVFSVSLWSNMNILSVAVRGPIFWICAGLLSVCMGMSACVWML